MRTIVADVVQVADTGDFTGETPVWSAREGALYWINVMAGPGPAVHRLDVSTGTVRTWPMPDRTGAVALKEAGGLLVALSTGVHDFDPGDGSLNLRAASPLPSDIALHEGRCDPSGRFWIASSDDDFMLTGERGGASLCRLDADGLKPVVAGITVSNGLAFSPDGRTLYLADSVTGRVDAWDCDPSSGELSGRRHFVTGPFEAGVVGMDGAAVDSEGCYWAAVFGESVLRRWRPDGEPDLEIRLPFSQPTMLTFGGAQLDTIYVTTSSMVLDPARCQASAQHGGVFALKAPVKGLPEPMFRDFQSSSERSGNKSQ